MPSSQVQITTRGRIGASDKDYAARKLGKLISRSPSPVVFARVKLDLEANPSLERPATAEVALELDGAVVRAHGTARMMAEAIDLLVQRLRRKLKDRERRRAMHQRLQGEGWQHGRSAPAWMPSLPASPGQHETS